MALTQTLEEGLKISNTPSDGKFLQYKDSTDKLTWATVSTTDSTKMPLAGGTFTGDVIFDGDNANITFDKSTDDLIFDDNAQAIFGAGSDLFLYSNGTHGFVGCQHSGGSLNLGTTSSNAQMTFDSSGVRIASDLKMDNGTTAALSTGSMITIEPHSSNDTDGIRFKERNANGSAYIGLKGVLDKGSDASYTITLPSAAPTANGQALTATTAGAASWTTISGGAALTGSTNNTITTVTGANAIQGEANLTFDGTTLTASGSTTAANNTNTDANIIAGSQTLIRQKGNDAGIGGDAYPSQIISGTAGGDLELYTINNNCDVVVGTQAAERLRIESDGDVKINDGNLVIGTSGHGIDFSAHGNAAGASSEVLDDYETGTWTIDGDTANFNGFGSVDCHYSKVGRLVTISGTMVCNTNSSSTSFYVKFIPFAPDTKINIPVASHVSAGDDGLFFIIDAGGTTGYLRNASFGIQTYGTFSNQTLYFTCSYVSNA